jgi:hypothetical protein
MSRVILCYNIALKRVSCLPRMSRVRIRCERTIQTRVKSQDTGVVVLMTSDRRVA